MLKTGFVSLFALVAATPALAQDVSGEETSADATIVVTASRSGEGVAADRLGASVTVIDADALEQRQTRLVSDVLRDVPGVAVSRQIGGLTQLRVRGTEANHVLVLIDGIEAADPYQGEFDFGTLIADPAARIEVLRGQQSSLYGSDAIGGVVHYITLSGAEAPGLTARAEAGSFGTLSAAARAGGVAGTLDYALSGAWYSTDGTPTARGGKRTIGSENLGASAKVNWRPAGDTLRLTAVLRYSRSEGDSNNTAGAPATTVPGFITVVDSPGVRFENEALYGLVEAQLTALDGRWTNTLSGQFSDTTRSGFVATGLDYGNKGQRYKGSFASSIRFGTQGVEHRLTGAVDVERERFRNTSPGTGSPFDAFTGRRDTDTLGLVAQYELDAGGLSAGASVRHDDNNRFDDATTWRVQGSYRFGTGTRVRAAYGTGIKNPGYYELYGFSDGRYIGNPGLRPERSEGWEAGIEHAFAGGLTTIGATYFDSRLEHEIYTTYPAPTFVATPANRATRSRQHGIELFVAARPLPQLRLDAAYTNLKARENGVEEVRRPGDMLSFNMTFLGRDERFAATLTVRHNGPMTDIAFADPSFASVPVSLDAFTLVNLSVQYGLTDRISLFGRVENLLDSDYEEVFSYATPGAGAFGGVRVRF